MKENRLFRSIHPLPPPLSKRSTKSEIFLTGIKAIGVLIPLERGSKAGLFGEAGVELFGVGSGFVALNGDVAKKRVG